MINAHSYDPASDSGFMASEGPPGRVTLCYSTPGERSISFKMSEDLFLKVVEKYVAAGKKAGETKASARSRKAASAGPGVDYI